MGYGPQRDYVALHHPNFILYRELEEPEKAYDCTSVFETIKAILVFGYSIEKRDSHDSAEEQVMVDSSEGTIEGVPNKGISKEFYGQNPKYQDHLLEQYKIYVEMADRISARRNLANTFFLTLHTFLIGIFGFTIKEDIAVQNGWLLLVPLFAVLALCAAWWRLVKSYRQLNTAKYKVIGELEKYLPASPYYAAEWKALGEGKDRKLYIPLTGIEQWVPVIFGFLYSLGYFLLIFHPNL